MQLKSSILEFRFQFPAAPYSAEFIHKQYSQISYCAVMQSQAREQYRTGYGNITSVHWYVYSMVRLCLYLSLILGEFGIVYKAQIKSNFADTISETVAVKTLKGL